VRMTDDGLVRVPAVRRSASKPLRDRHLVRGAALNSGRMAEGLRCRMNKGRHIHS
jgi:hypothetical protein